MHLRDRQYPARHATDDLGDRSNIVFVTVNTKDRKPLLARSDAQDLLLHYWRDTSHWLVGRYVIMPDHLHLFCAPSGPEVLNVRDWVAYWKSMTARHWPRLDEKPIWQREAWDRQLRRGDSYSVKWEYVRNNPVRHGFVPQAEDWPYQGELNVLMWHDV
jgi:REP element-mobilizing transposase RayT